MADFPDLEKPPPLVIVLLVPRGVVAFTPRSNGPGLIGKMDRKNIFALSKVKTKKTFLNFDTEVSNMQKELFMFRGPSISAKRQSDATHTTVSVTLTRSKTQVFGGLQVVKLKHSQQMRTMV